jgi:hypothetical protein
MRIRFILPFVAALVSSVAPGIAHAEEGTTEPNSNDLGTVSSFDSEGEMASFETVSEEELGNQRGGFVVAGMDVRLGAEMRTYMNGELVLHTVVNWNDTGITSQQTFSGALTPANLEAIRASMGVPNSSPDNPIYLANGGQTALSQTIDGAIQNVIVNSANNLAISQETSATIDIAGYRSFQNEVLNQRILDSLSGTMGAMTASAFGR